MKKFRKLFLTFLFLCVVSSASFASHIVGGVINYQRISGRTYLVTLKIYRDCSSSTGFDVNPSIGIFDELTNVRVSIFYVASPLITRVDPVITNPCLAASAVCIEEGIYVDTITLPTGNRSYYLSYSRCCRNSSVTNLTTPGSVGMSLSVRIPAADSIPNSNPIYNTFPPVYICQNTPVVINYSASDADGDSLYYQLCNPYAGGSTGSPMPLPGPLPFTPLTYVVPYSSLDPLGSSPAPAIGMSIEPSTGVLTGTPPTVGQFVMPVCVSEFRSGVFLSTTMRDFQINVIPCPVPFAFIPSYNIDPSTRIGTFALNCKGNTINFLNGSTGSTYYHWDFGVNSIDSDTSNVITPTFTFPDTGRYLVTLVAYNSAGCLDSTAAYVNIYPGLIADFLSSTYCIDSSVRFLDQSISPPGPLASWKWYFGDGDSSVLKNPLHHYASTGSYNVRLNIINNIGCDTSISKSITIFAQPNPNFTVDSTCLNAPVRFSNTSTISSGTISSYDWNFGDGSSHSSSTSPVHTYSSVGSFTVTLTTVSDSGCIKSRSKTIVIHALPVVTTSPDTIFCTGSLGAQLSASGGVSYLWTPSSSLSSAFVSNPLATPLINTVYIVSVGDTNRCRNTDSVIVNIATLTPNFLFTNECLDTAVAFIDTSTSFGSFITQWKWSFGDLTNSILSNPSHAYSSVGLYNVKLVLTSNKGCKDSITKEVRIYPIPHPGFTFDSTCINSPIIFTDTTRYFLTGDTIMSRIWAWGDGTPNTVGPMNPTHTYRTAGIYNVSLTVRTDSGCTQYSTRNVIVHPRPNISTSRDTSICPGSVTQIAASGGVSYLWSPSTNLSSTSIANPISNTLSNITYQVRVADTNRCQNFDSVAINIFVNTPNFNFNNECLDTAVQFNDLSTTTGGSVSQWYWTFGDAGTSIVQNPLHLYPTSGFYNAKLVITTDKGCMDSITKTVSIYPIVNPGFTFDSSCVGKLVSFLDTTHYFYSSDSIVSRTWNWGDGTPNTIANPSPNHLYATAGSYLVSLIVRNDSGCTQSFTRNVLIHPSPTILTSSDTFICPGSNTQISASGGVAYFWSPSTSLSDSSISNPTSNTLSNITYRVLVADSNRCQATDSISVELYRNNPDFTFTNECLDTSVQFFDLSNSTGGLINKWNWNFGDGTIDSIQNPSHLYASAGTYNTKIIFTTIEGCMDSIDKVVRIYPIPNPGFIYDSACINEPVFFSDTSNYFYGGDSIQSRVWSLGDGSPNITGSASFNHTYASAGNYSVVLTVRNDSGCTQKITRSVYVNPLPLINLTGDTTICPNQSLQLFAFGGVSFSWRLNSTLSDTAINNPIASPIGNSLYYVTVIDTNRCKNNDSVSVHIYTLNPVSAGLDTSVCLSPTSFFDSVQLNASGGSRYLWTPNYNISNDSISNPWVSPDINTDYSARITDINGCIQYDSVRVVVLDPALDLLTAKDTFLCKNDTIKVRVIDQGVEGYTWSPILGLSNPSIRSPYFFPTDTSTYFLNVLNYCYTKNDTMKFNVYPLPIVNFTLDTTCINSPVDFTDLSSSNVRSWNWSFGDGYNDSIQNPTHTYTSSGSVLVRLIDTTNLGCYDSLSRSITIHPIPITNPLRDTILCQNKYANFQSSGGITYFWSPAADLDNPSSSNPTTTVLTNGIYTVTVADINKCQAFDTVLTTYNFLFPRLYTENKCLDSLVSFIDSSTTNTGIINVWNWNFGDGNTSTIQNPFHLYGSPGVFNVTMYIENSSGCDTSISTNIEIYSLPKLPYDNDTICLGDRYQIISDSNYRHLWTYNPTLSTLTTYNPIANTSTSTNYYVTLTDTHFCINKDTFNLQVNLKPSIRISLTDPYFCTGDSITLYAISTASKIVWNNGSSLSDSTIFNPIAYLNDTITYKVRVEDGAGCFNIDSTTLIVEQKVIAIAYMDTMICRGSALHLSADGGKYYDWTPTTYLQASTLQMVRSRPDSSIIYTVNVSNDCFSDDTFISIFVNQLPLAYAGPDVSIYRNETANLLASGGISYSWFPDNSLSTPFSQSAIASPFYNTNYIVWVTDSNGCTAFDTVLVEVIANTVLLMPTAFSPDGNGINDVFRISKTLNVEQLISFEIYNRWGVKVFETSDINQGWDGNFKGREQPMSSFTWIIKAKDYDGLDILRSGIVTLLR